MGGIAEIGIRVFLIDQATAGIRTLGLSLQQLAIVGGLAAAFALFGGALVYTIVQAATLQTQLTRLQIATSASAAGMQQLQTFVLQVGGASVFSAQQLVAGMVVIAQFGFRTVAALEMVSLAGVHLSEALGTTAVVGMTLLGTAMKAFLIPASQATATADLLFYSVQHGTPNIAQFQAGIAQAAIAADVLHISLADLIPAFDVLTPMMGSATLVGTSLRWALGRLADPTHQQAVEQQALGLSVFDSTGHFIGFNAVITELYNILKDKTPEQQFQALTQLVTLRGAQALMGLITHFNEYTAAVDKLKAANYAAGQSAAAAALVMATLGGMWQAIQTNIAHIAALIGTALVPALSGAASGFLALTNQVMAAAAKDPQATSQFLLLAAAISGIGLVAFIATTPLGALIGTVLLIVGAAAVASFAILGLENLYDSLSSNAQANAQKIAAANLSIAQGVDTKMLATNYTSMEQMATAHAQLEQLIATTHSSTMKQIYQGMLATLESDQKAADARQLALAQDRDAKELALHKTTAGQMILAERALQSDLRSAWDTTQWIATLTKQRDALLAQLKITHDAEKKAEIQHQIDMLQAQINGGNLELIQDQKDADKQRQIIATGHKNLLSDHTTYWQNYAKIQNTGQTIGQTSNAGFWTQMNTVTATQSSLQRQTIQTAWTNITTAIQTALDNNKRIETVAGQTEVTNWNTQGNTLRTGITTSWTNITTAIQTALNNQHTIMQTAGQQQVSSWNTQGQQLRNAFQTTWDKIKAIVQAAVGVIQSLINNITSAIQGIPAPTLPHVPGVPGFQSGVTNFGGGLAYVHAGELLVNLARGTSVIPANQVGGMSPTIIYLDGKVIYDNTMSRMQGQLQLNAMGRAFR